MRITLFTLVILLFVGITTAQPNTPLIAIVEEGNLYLWQDGTRTALIDTGNVERVWLKPDGTRLVFAQDDGRVFEPGHDEFLGFQYQSTSLWAIDIDAENLQPLVDLDDYREGFDYGESILIDDLEWVSHSSLVAFNTFRRSEEAPFSDTYANLYVVDTETGERVLVHTSEEKGHFTMSPDGKYAAIATDTSISLIGLDGQTALPDVFTFEASPDTGHANYYPDMRWAADSQSLVAIDLTSRVGWTEKDDKGKLVHPAIDLVRIHVDGTTKVLASTTRPDLNYWTLRFVANGPQIIYSFGDESACKFDLLTLEEEIQLTSSSENTVRCFGSEYFAFMALTPEGIAYRLDQRPEVATLSRACDDFSACETVQEIEGKIFSIDFIGETQYIYRVVVADENAGTFQETRDLFYAQLGEEPQFIGTTDLQFSSDRFSVNHQ